MNSLPKVNLGFEDNAKEITACALSEKLYWRKISCTLQIPQKDTSTLRYLKGFHLTEYFISCVFDATPAMP